MLISGSGSTLRNILERSADGRLRGVEVVGVIASKQCPGLDIASAYQLPCAVETRIGSSAAAFDPLEFSARLTAQLDKWQPELIACGGFLSLYIPAPQYADRVINIHPALLPAFGGPGMYGDRVHAAVLASGAKVSGCTVHYASSAYDEGPIIAQRTVPVLEGDTVETLGGRVREAERELYPTVIQWFADGRVKLVDGVVQVKGRSF
jgi:formyltetrahydrofolate-dependent phosphoribosylglycinamide formyltransferase